MTAVSGKKKGISTRMLVQIAILGALAAVLQMIAAPLPFLPPWMKIDFADLPVLLGAFAMNPLAGVIIALIKNIVGLFTSSTGGVGELANFIISASLVLPASIIYHRKPSRKSAAIGLVFGVIAMTIMGVLMNYYVLLPIYIKLMFGGSADALLSLAAKSNGVYTSIWGICIFGVIPFNILKGAIVSVVCLLIYKPLSRFLKPGKTEGKSANKIFSQKKKEH